jgi:prepilin-type N-terminal cleavage/methylation domain-containing protein/prepilin-type processing-associated H-X9-DG protein
MNRQLRNRGCPAVCCAFTLVEMMVVIAVIGILESLLLPAVSRTKSAARSAACKANLHQLGFALRSGCKADAAPNGLGLGNPTWMDLTWPRVVGSYSLRLIETSESKVKQPDDMIAVTCSNLRDQRSVGPSLNLVQFWPANSHHGGANVLFCDSHVEHGKQARWIEKTVRAWRRWNNDHEPHPPLR